MGAKEKAITAKLDSEITVNNSPSTNIIIIYL